MKKIFKKFKKRHVRLVKKISQIITGVVVVAAMTFVVSAFTQPSSAPPGGNVSAPLNISATTQTKTGKLNFPWFEDQDQPGYYVDPGGNSWLYRIYTYYLNVAGNIVGSGATSNYGALTIDGSKNGWSGINFKSGGANVGTLMVHKDYQGFYNDSDNNWDWYFTNGVLTAGTVPWSSITGAPAAEGVPSGTVIMFDGQSCPSGWSRYGQLDNRFPRGSGSTGATGGEETHSHSTPFANMDGNTLISGGGGGYDPNWADRQARNTDSASNMPPYFNILFCRKN